jgi:CheY-like chemotaxis protein
MSKSLPHGEKGLQRLRETHFDLLISDVLMSALSGYELCRKLKGSRQTANRRERWSG